MTIMNHPNAALAHFVGSFLGGEGSIPASNARDIISSSSSMVSGAVLAIFYESELAYSIVIIARLKPRIPSRLRG